MGSQPDEIVDRILPPVRAFSASNSPGEGASVHARRSQAIIFMKINQLRVRLSEPCAHVDRLGGIIHN